jgi:hypothetical protein
MELESPQAELLRLLKEQRKTREDEVFGGLSAAERSAYNTKKSRIDELEHRFSEERTAAGRKAKQNTGWNDTIETDLAHQNEARQPYREREKDSERFVEKTLNAGSGEEPEKERE